MKRTTIFGHKMTAAVERACMAAIAMFWLGVIALLLGTATGLAQAQTPATAAAGPVIYPAKGQSAKQLDKDKYECHDWARGQTGYDPTQPVQTAATPQASASSQGKQNKSAASGMVTGAMGGAAIAELSNHDAGRGAATGALGGAMLQRVKQQQAQTQQLQQQAAQQQQATQQQAAQQQARNQQRATYERALGACMEGRGYTVK